MTQLYSDQPRAQLQATESRAQLYANIQEALNGKAVDWLEHVSDEQYQA